MIYIFACDKYGSYIESAGDWDCDDTRSDVNPGEEEECDAFDIDENCNGEINEPGAAGGVIFYRDWDGDGYGDPLDSEMLCEAGDIETYDVTDNDDCCDIDWQANPAWTEHRGFETWCGGYDWNCDGVEAKEYHPTGGCGLGGSVCDPDPEGWRYSTPPSCGSYGDWVIECDIDWGIPPSCAKVYISQEQWCL